MTNHNTKKSSIKSIIFSGLLAFSFMGIDNAFSKSFSADQKNADGILRQYNDSYNKIVHANSFSDYGITTCNIKDMDKDDINTLFKENDIPQGSVINNPAVWSNYTPEGIPTMTEQYMIITSEAYDLLEKNKKILKNKLEERRRIR